MFKKSKELQNNEASNEIEKPKERYISRKKTTNYWWNKISII